MEHIMFCKNQTNEYDNIILNNQRLIIRATNNRRIPHSRIFKGERIYFTNRLDTKISYVADVKEVYNYSKLLDSQIKQILNDNQKELNIADNDLKKYYKKCICLIEIENLQQIPTINIAIQAPFIDWIILEDINDIIV